MALEDLGFGAVEACLEGVGISCDECIYGGVCRGGDDGFRQER